jgi:hypothetical protein
LDYKGIEMEGIKQAAPFEVVGVERIAAAVERLAASAERQPSKSAQILGVAATAAGALGFFTLLDIMIRWIGG